jgi:hypothetical protein
MTDTPDSNGNGTTQLRVTVATLSEQLKQVQIDAKLAAAKADLGVQTAEANQAEFREFRTAIQGMPNVSKGAIQEIFEAQQRTQDTVTQLSATLPTVINGAIEAAMAKSRAGRVQIVVNTVRTYWVAAAASVTSSLATGGIFYWIFHTVSGPGSTIVGK